MVNHLKPTCYIFIRLSISSPSSTNGKLCRLALPCVQSTLKKLGALEKATESATMVNPATEQGNEPHLHDFTSPTRASLQVGEVHNVAPCLKELKNLLLPLKKLRPLEKATKLATMVDSATEQGNDPHLHELTSATRTSLQVGEAQNVPFLKELEHLLVFSKKAYSGGAAGARKVKIVVTREQFKLLLAKAKKMQSQDRLLSYTGPGRGYRKWQPTLSAISEEQTCIAYREMMEVQ